MLVVISPPKLTMLSLPAFQRLDEEPSAELCAEKSCLVDLDNLIRWLHVTSSMVEKRFEVSRKTSKSRSKVSGTRDLRRAGGAAKKQHFFSVGHR